VDDGEFDDSDFMVVFVLIYSTGCYWKYRQGGGC
jgi:hypothetical protein